MHEKIPVVRWITTNNCELDEFRNESILLDQLLGFNFYACNYSAKYIVQINPSAFCKPAKKQTQITRLSLIRKYVAPAMREALLYCTEICTEGAILVLENNIDDIIQSFKNDDFILDKMERISSLPFIEQSNHLYASELFIRDIKTSSYVKEYVQYADEVDASAIWNEKKNKNT